MTQNAYSAALQQAEDDLRDIEEQRQAFEAKVARLNQTIASLRALIDPEAETELGLPEGPRRVFRDALVSPVK